MVNLRTYHPRSTESASDLFVEVQHYRRTWIWILLGLALGSLMVIAIAQWVWFSAQDTYWLSFSSLMLMGVAVLLLAGLIHQAHLVTKIDRDGLRFRWFPVQWFYQQIDWQKVEEVYIREYDAISDYGGWGVRFGQQGKGYTIAGRFGIQLVLTDERRILIGTQRPIELEQLILRLLYDYEVK